MSPMMLSGVPVGHADAAAAAAHAHQLVGDALLVGGEHRADARHHHVEGPVVEGQRLGVGDLRAQLHPVELGREPASSSSSGT
jgi:hypothetical protein